MSRNVLFVLLLATGVVLADNKLESDHAGTAEANRYSYYPREMYVCLYYDATVQLRKSGVLFAD